MVGRWLSSRLLRALWPVGACALTLLAFYAVGSIFLGSYVLDLGSPALPAVRHTYFLFFWGSLGSIAAFFLHVGLTRLQALNPGAAAAAAADGTAGQGRWLAVTMAAAFLLPCAVRAFLLRGAVLTDDESAYRFMAQVLATGRLAIESHPMKAFFDRTFMINDGRFYAAYFVGWPALMIPGAYLGITGYMNAVYSALTVPALYQTVRRLAGAPAGQVATLLYLASPMLFVGAATEMSHTSCLMAAAWSIYLLLRSREEPAAWWTHAGVAFFFSLGFMIRPLSTLGVGLPILVSWFVGIVRLPAATRRRALVAFAVPALVMSTLFLAVNVAQNGSPFVSSYARYQQYIREVTLRNVGWSPAGSPLSLREYILGNGQWMLSLANTTVALVRLAFDLFGSPLCVVLVGLAWAVKPARVVWLSALFFVAVHFSIHDSGIDSFGPVHFFELALPVLVLAGVGFGRLAAVAREWRPMIPPSWPVSVVASLVLVSAIGFVPVRLHALKMIASNVNAPIDAAKDAGLTRAVVFTSRMWVPQKCIAPIRHFVFFRPNNDPGLTNDMLWVNDLGWDQDRELMRTVPGRSGYVMTWDGCRPRFQRF
jgi:4-amino-4-deoxy-L-arabinose transferase-like glycosyltransferase